jgi:hypothetical protein
MSELLRSAEGTTPPNPSAASILQRLETFHQRFREEI